jgi:hypothetical protein
MLRSRSKSVLWRSWNWKGWGLDSFNIDFIDYINRSQPQWTMFPAVILYQAVFRSDKPNIVIGTPGRLRDLYERRILNLSRINFFVIDECDKVLNTSSLADLFTTCLFHFTLFFLLFFSCVLWDFLYLPAVLIIFREWFIINQFSYLWSGMKLLMIVINFSYGKKNENVYLLLEYCVFLLISCC